jgi:peroxiredoxin
MSQKSIRWRGANYDYADDLAPTLAARLENLTARVREMVGAENLAAPEKAVEELIASGAVRNIWPVGATAPAFELPDTKNQPVRSADLLAQGKLVVVFYRGRWCPYCIADLETFRDLYPEIQKRGALLVAISPQKVQHSDFTATQHALPFPVLSDAGNEVARQFGLVYQVPDYLQEHYQRIFVNLPNANGDSTWTLPMPAVYVLDRDGKVLFAEAQADFRRRTEPSDILQVL